MQSSKAESLLEVQDLRTTFYTRHGSHTAVDQVSLSIGAGEILGVVGESGSGKSVTVMSSLKLIHEPPGRIEGGSVFYSQEDLLQLEESSLRRVRGKEIGFIFQDPTSSLNPVLSIGDLFTDVLRAHGRWSSDDARDRGVKLLKETGVNSPELRWNQYPHELSGGMKQRVLIAMAIANDPKLLIADEATTALDVTTQAAILDLFRQLRETRNLAIILITHDLGLIAEIADQVVVMYGGRIVESTTVQELFDNPRHPYTVGLLQSRPTRGSRHERFYQVPGHYDPDALGSIGCGFQPRCGLERDRQICTDQDPALVKVTAEHSARCHFIEETPDFANQITVDLARKARESRDGSARAHVGSASEDAHGSDRRDDLPAALELVAVSKRFAGRRSLSLRKPGGVQAVDRVSLSVPQGQTLALVGESGSGKTTVGRLAALLVQPDEGEITLFGGQVASPSRSEMRKVRRQVQMVFQNPFGSLNPRMRVHELISEPLQILAGIESKDERMGRVRELLDLVGLEEKHQWRYPAEFSGGQRQRIAIARALASSPKLLVLDEPVSALDVSVQARILNLLKDLQDRLGLAYLFVTHDLNVAHGVADKVAVMYMGQVIEYGDWSAVVDAPTHPYTKALLSSAPIENPKERGSGRRVLLEGDVPSATDPPSGCRFRTRCWKADDLCASDEPPLVTRQTGQAMQMSACHHPESGWESTAVEQ